MPSLKSKAQAATAKTARKFSQSRVSATQKCRKCARVARAKKKCRPTPETEWKPRKRFKSCAAAWADVLRHTDTIWKLHGRKDKESFIARNVRITRAYAKLFLGHRSFRFIGAAAFASKQVWCALQRAKGFFGGLRDWNLLPEPVDPATISEVIFAALSLGNVTIFKSVYPMHLFYHRYGRKRLSKCSRPRRPGAPRRYLPVFRRAFRELDAGCTLRANVRLARYEQKQILQYTVFNKKKVKKAFGRVQDFTDLTGLDFAATKVEFSPACSGGKTILFNGDNVANVGERWEFAYDALAFFNSLHRNERYDLVCDLRAIAGVRPCRGRR